MRMAIFLLFRQLSALVIYSRKANVPALATEVHFLVVDHDIDTPFRPLVEAQLMVIPQNYI